MAITRSDQVYSGTLTTNEVTVATIAANTTFVMKGFWISNSNATTDKYAILKIDDKRFVPSTPVPYKNALIQDNLNIPITTGKTIKFQGEVANDMDYYIWGVNEVSS